MTRVIKADAESYAGNVQAGVLNLSDIAAEAREVILDARKESARIVAQARAGAQAVQQSAQKKGYDEGFAQGRNDGQAAGKVTAQQEAAQNLAAGSSQLAAEAKKILDELAAAREQMLNDAKTEMLELAIELAKKIVARVAVADIEAARANMAKALEMAHTAGELVVKVNPSQLAELTECCRELVETIGLRADVRLIGDEWIEAGGVMVVSRHGEIDATVRTQLDNVVAALLGGTAAL